MCSIAIRRWISSLRHSPTWGLTSLAGMTDLIWGMETRSSRPCTARELTSRRMMYVHPDLLRASEGRTGLSGSKRKRGSIHLALDQTNEQLRQIAEWPERALANDNHVRTEFFWILREMRELTSLDRTLLQRHLLSRMDDLRGFILMLEDEREEFCRVLLRDITR
uniref:Retrotransposon protein n=1 Tax=Cucumis melo TaxID=3656 RepID=A0A9I9E8C1_CUCME